MRYIDTHSHFNMEQFNTDRDQAIERMIQNQVGTICVGIDYESSREAKTIAEIHHGIWSSVGLHPTHWGQGFDIKNFEKLAKDSSKIVAIGECGLDYSKETFRRAKNEQREIFEAQIALTQKLNLPLILHIRPTANTQDAYEDAFFVLQNARNFWPSMRGTAHFFVGSKEMAERFINLGFHISFSGVITIYPEFEDVVKSVPLDRILAETDAPFAAPLSQRGKRNEPVFVREIIQKIAELKEVPITLAETQLFNNAKSLFRLT